MRKISVSTPNGLEQTDLFTDGQYLAVTRGLHHGYAVTHKATGLSLIHLEKLKWARQLLKLVDGPDFKFQQVSELEPLKKASLKRIVYQLADEISNGVNL